MFAHFLGDNDLVYESLQTGVARALSQSYYLKTMSADAHQTSGMVCPSARRAEAIQRHEQDPKLGYRAELASSPNLALPLTTYVTFGRSLVAAYASVSLTAK